MSRIATLHMLRSAISDSLRSRGFIISWLNPTPHATAVYASCSALPPPHATLASRRLARPYLGRTCTGWIAPALPGAFHSFDHLVGATEEREREGDAEGFGRLEVDKQLDFRDLLDRQISRLVALDYASGIDASLTVRLRKTASITHQAAGGSEVARLVDRGHRVADS
jgi:hypothetical protein